jgi:hypothetical protein
VASVSEDRLARTLSRDRAKDMASDYEQSDSAQGYAERRGITFRGRVAMPRSLSGTTLLTSTAWTNITPRCQGLNRGQDKSQTCAQCCIMRSRSTQ